MTSYSRSVLKGDILVVDDKPDNLRLLSTMLIEQGYKVRKAINGELALTAVHATIPDLILLDINMPKLNGYQVCQILKQSETTKDIPVIFISALDDVVDKVEAFRWGGSDYITKPFELEEVLVRVEHQLTIRRLQKQLQEQNLMLQKEIRAHKRAEDEIRFLLQTTQAISASVDFHSALEVTLRQLCETIAWNYGEAWIPNDENACLECSRGWYASDSELGEPLPVLAEFRRQSQTFTFAANDGIIGRVWSSKQPEWLADVSQERDPIFIRYQFAREAGLKACFGVPILVNNQVLAVLMFFKFTTSSLEQRVMDLVLAIASQLGSLIQRKQAEDALQQANQELQRLAIIDDLTNVANRRRFYEYLPQEWRRMAQKCSPLSLILCDVDYFKSYNDTYGHLAGDICLQKIAFAITQCTKQSGDLVARYGGEEFVIILPDTVVEEAFKIAEEIRLKIQDLKISHARSSVYQWVTVSLGVSGTVPTPELDAEALIAVTDAALYEAKEQGRNRSILKSFNCKIL